MVQTLRKIVEHAMDDCTMVQTLRKIVDHAIDALHITVDTSRASRLLEAFQQKNDAKCTKYCDCASYYVALLHFAGHFSVASGKIRVYIYLQTVVS